MKRKPHLLLLHTFHRNYPIQAFQLSQQQQQQHASPPYIPNISNPYIQPQYPQHSELDQLDYLLGVPSGTASVIDVRAATDSNILEEIVAATTPGQDQEPQNAHRVKEGTTVKGDETIVSHSQGEERHHNLLISRYEDGNSSVILKLFNIFFFSGEFKSFHEAYSSLRLLETLDDLGIQDNLDGQVLQEFLR